MTASEPAGRVRRRFEVTGVVQGVGFRPFVYVAAAELALTGSVLNDVSGVVIEVEGDAAAVTDFGHRLRRDARRSRWSKPSARVTTLRSGDRIHDQ
ncbi:MAG: acylphosphatase [Nocardioidaceae bacterium]